MRENKGRTQIQAGVKEKKKTQREISISHYIAVHICITEPTVYISTTLLLYINI